MRKNFRGKLNGEELVMDVTGMNLQEIRYNINSKEIILVEAEAVSKPKVVSKPAVVAPKPTPKVTPKVVAKKVVAKKAPTKVKKK